MVYESKYLRAAPEVLRKRKNLTERTVSLISVNLLIEDAGFCMPETVDALLDITYSEYIATLSGDLADDVILKPCVILILINIDLDKFILIEMCGIFSIKDIVSSIFLIGKIHSVNSGLKLGKTPVDLKKKLDHGAGNFCSFLLKFKQPALLVILQQREKISQFLRSGTLDGRNVFRLFENKVKDCSYRIRLKVIFIEKNRIVLQNVRLFRHA